MSLAMDVKIDALEAGPKSSEVLRRISEGRKRQKKVNEAIKWVQSLWEHAIKLKQMETNHGLIQGTKINDGYNEYMVTAVWWSQGKVKGIEFRKVIDTIELGEVTTSLGQDVYERTIEQMLEAVKSGKISIPGFKRH